MGDWRVDVVGVTAAKWPFSAVLWEETRIQEMPVEIPPPLKHRSYLSLWGHLSKFMSHFPGLSIIIIIVILPADVHVAR